jgi:hypothetical protein
VKKTQQQKKSLKSKKSFQKQQAFSFEIDETVYRYPEDAGVILAQLDDAPLVYYKKQKPYGNVYYYNIPASFDIEDSSFRMHVSEETQDETKQGGRKFSTMYVWQFSINGKVIIGRTWEEFEELISKIHEIVDPQHRLIVYVHYLGHEFSFIQKRFNWDKVFCSSERTPIYAITTGGVEFRDSYILTGKSLEKSAEDLAKYKVSKLSGDLDYSLIRGSRTPMSDKELGYCVHDCLVVDAIIQEKIEQEEKGIAGIPLTNTGYVRRFLRSKCFSTKNEEEYHELMKTLTLSGSEYLMLKRCFAGGFTHANARYVGKTFNERVDSFDFTSSYPTVMLSEMFPMSKGERIKNITSEIFRDSLKNYLCIFNIQFTNIRMKNDVSENIISSSKCFRLENSVINNGRVVRASLLETTITNVDFSYYHNFYEWDSIKIGTLYRYKKAYLPKPIIEALLELYKEKTELKGVDDKVVEYMVKKGMFNACYGCIVTDIIKEVIEYDNELGWTSEKPNIEDSIEKYNKSKNRFLFYPWGVFVTAYARRNLFTGIYEFNHCDDNCTDDYIYTDTDSIKCINAVNHMKYIEKYNKMITIKVNNVLQYYHLDTKLSHPKTIKGVEKQIGVWDWETEKTPYTKFKTLGAKRYMYEEDGKIHTTIAGLGKKKGSEYIASKDNPFDFFDDGMSIDSDHTGKLTHTYIDNEMSGMLVDYLGNEMEFHELSGVNLEPSPFSISEAKEFKEYCQGFHNVFM